MPDIATRILQSLSTVDLERRRRAATPGLAVTVAALKTYQRQRFARTHAGLLAHPRYGRAANFFLDELYGPRDFTQRDAQFSRIVPALVRLFPADTVGTVESLAAVHALSERLDTSMALQLGDAAPGRATCSRGREPANPRRGRARSSWS